MVAYHTIPAFVFYKGVLITEPSILKSFVFPVFHTQSPHLCSQGGTRRVRKSAKIGCFFSKKRDARFHELGGIFGPGIRESYTI